MLFYGFLVIKEPYIFHYLSSSLKSGYDFHRDDFEKTLQHTYKTVYLYTLYCRVTHKYCVATKNTIQLNIIFAFFSQIIVLFMFIVLFCSNCQHKSLDSPKNTQKMLCAEITLKIVCSVFFNNFQKMPRPLSHRGRKPL